MSVNALFSSTILPYDISTDEMETSMPMFITAIAVYGTGDALSAQTAASSGTEWSPKLRRKAADQVAKQVEAIRASAKLPPLKRVKPSLES